MLYFLKANSLRLMGRYQEALANYDLSISLQSNLDFYNDKGIVLIELGRYQEAIDCYNQIINNNPNYDFAYLNKGVALQIRGTYEEAINCYKIALKINKDNSMAAANLLVAYKEAHDANSLLTLKQNPNRLRLLGKLKLNHLPNHYDCALLSDAVYYGTKAELSAAWVLLVTSKDKRFEGAYDKLGYSGAAYRHVTTGHVVIAHEGTTVNLDKFRADQELFYAELPEQFKIAHKFSEWVKREFKSQTHSYVGHSLGGALAELSAWEDNVPAVTFDSPGVKEVIDRRLGRTIHPHDVNVVAYLSEPNIVNTMASHVGLQVRIFPTHVQNKELSFTGLLKSKLLGSVLENYQRHALRPIIGAFDPETGRPRTSALITRWPQGQAQLLQFVEFCKQINAHDFDPQAERLTEASDKTWLSQIYATQYINSKQIPLQQFKPEVQIFLIDYLEDKKNPQALSEEVIANYMIEDSNGEKVVVIKHPHLTADDFRTYINYQFSAKKSIYLYSANSSTSELITKLNAIWLGGSLHTEEDENQSSDTMKYKK